MEAFRRVGRGVDELSHSISKGKRIMTAPLLQQSIEPQQRSMIYEQKSDLEFETKARSIFRGFDFKETQLQKSFLELFGGWRMRYMLIIVLVQDVDVMILDEPAIFLDCMSIIWLQNYLVALQLTQVRRMLRLKIMGPVAMTGQKMSGGRRMERDLFSGKG